jgi:large subunit ribosomal protein L9
VVKIPASCGADGRLYGSVTSKDIVERLQADHKIAIDKRKLVLGDPIKAYGKYEVEVKLYTEVTGKINVLVCEK